MTTTEHSLDPRACESDRYRDALRYLYERIDYERMAAKATTRYPFRLQRVTELLHELNLQSYLYAESQQPKVPLEPKVPLVHIAGTKGKGSVATMVAAALTACGLRTGLYTSPHLHRLEERFRIDGIPCSPADLISLVQRVESATEQVERSSGAPSFFDLTTAMALLHFDSAQCDALVIEVGLGGRLDSTNVCAPSVSVVTSIGLDHQHVLGNDVRSIASEKAGIIKSGVPVVSGVTDRAAADVVRQRADECGSTLYAIGRDFSCESEPLRQWGSRVKFRGTTAGLTPHATISLSMEGRHQATNAAIALATIDVLRDRETLAVARSQNRKDQSSHLIESRLKLPPELVYSAFSHLQCEARVEQFRLDHDVLAIVDAAHNADSIAALCQCLRDRSDNRPITVVFGTSIDKPAKFMLQSLASVAHRLILTRYHGNPRYIRPEEMLGLVDPVRGVNVTVIDDPIAACHLAREQATPGGTLVVCGSFFLAAETREWLLRNSESSVLEMGRAGKGSGTHSA